MRRQSAAMLAAAVLLGVIAGCSPSARATYYRQREHPVPASMGDGAPLAYQPEDTFTTLARRRRAEPVSVTVAGE